MFYLYHIMHIPLLQCLHLINIHVSMQVIVRACVLINSKLYLIFSLSESIIPSWYSELCPVICGERIPFIEPLVPDSDKELDPCNDVNEIATLLMQNI